MVGWRDGAIEKMINAYKYECVRAVGVVIAEMLDEVVPRLPADTVVVPVPTVARHVRERGFDHMWVVGKRLARMRGWECRGLVGRRVESVQVGASRARRLRQAEEAFEVRGGADSARHYLVVDDVWTTGATIEAMCRVLRRAGARHVVVAVVGKSRD
jgi:predicted amidophosphoribosyltransferase